MVHTSLDDAKKVDYTGIKKVTVDMPFEKQWFSDQMLSLGQMDPIDSKFSALSWTLHPANVQLCLSALLLAGFKRVNELAGMQCLAIGRNPEFIKTIQAVDALLVRVARCPMISLALLASMFSFSRIFIISPNFRWTRTTCVLACLLACTRPKSVSISLQLPSPVWRPQYLLTTFRACDTDHLLYLSFSSLRRSLYNRSLWRTHAHLLCATNRPGAATEHDFRPAHC